MNKIDVNEAIIQALKKEFEYREEDYDQWNKSRKLVSRPISRDSTQKGEN